MSKVKFEEDELNIIAMFEEETREDTITFIQEAASFLEEDDELRDLMNSTIVKLKQWTEEEFKAFDFSPYLFEEDDEDES